MEDDFSMDWGGGMVLGWFKGITFIVHFLFLLHQLHSDHQALDPGG